MAQIRLVPGRPTDHPLGPMLDAVRYVVHNGIEWPAMPVDFPPWQAGYAFHDRWSRRDLPQQLSYPLRHRLRHHAGRDVEPTAAIIDSQSLDAARARGATLRLGVRAGSGVPETLPWEAMIPPGRKLPLGLDAELEIYRDIIS